MDQKKRRRPRERETHHRQRERKTQRHCRASLLEIEIGHSVEISVQSGVSLRIVHHRIEKFRRELLIDNTDVYDRTIHNIQREEHAFREAKVRQGVRTQQLLEEVTCAYACSKPTAEKGTQRVGETSIEMHGLHQNKYELMALERCQRGQETTRC